MLFIVFKAGNADYALEARQVIEVTPFIALRPCPGAPASVAGLANYRGTGVPVVDLARLLGGASAGASLSTRIILTPYAIDEARRRIIGLLAESVTNTVQLEESDFSQASVTVPGAPGIGKLAVHGASFIQRVLPERLIPKELEQILFAEAEKIAS
jgi:chemotaxis-related protein WspB